MTTDFAPPSTVEETVAELVGLKAGVRAAIRGTHVMGPAIANQIVGLYELAGEDPDTADAMASAIRQRGGSIAEHLEAIAADLTAIGSHVARAIRAKEENDARRKVAAAKTGTRARAGATIEV
jgi:hypothetical protein